MFTVCLYGEIDKNEARRWYNSLCRYASSHHEPFYAVIDLRFVTFIGTRARIQFADATRLPQVLGLLFLTQEPHLLQAVRMIGMLGAPDTTHAFTSAEDARAFLERNATLQT